MRSATRRCCVRSPTRYGSPASDTLMDVRSGAARQQGHCGRGMVSSG